MYKLSQVKAVKVVREAFYLIEFVNPRNDWEIEMKPG